MVCIQFLTIHWDKWYSPSLRVDRWLFLMIPKPFFVCPTKALILKIANWSLLDGIIMLIHVKESFSQANIRFLEESGKERYLTMLWKVVFYRDSPSKMHSFRCFELICLIFMTLLCSSWLFGERCYPSFAMTNRETYPQQRFEGISGELWFLQFYSTLFRCFLGASYQTMCEVSCWWLIIEVRS